MVHLKAKSWSYKGNLIKKALKVAVLNGTFGNNVMFFQAKLDLKKVLKVAALNGIFENKVTVFQG